MGSALGRSATGMTTAPETAAGGVRPRLLSAGSCVPDPAGEGYGVLASAAAMRGSMVRKPKPPENAKAPAVRGLRQKRATGVEPATFSLEDLRGTPVDHGEPRKPG